MLSPELCEELITYWHAQGVVCRKESISSILRDDDLAVIWERVGMPEQDWWWFEFVAPAKNAMSGKDVVFGTIGKNEPSNWTLLYKAQNGECVVLDERGVERFANSDVGRFSKMLVLFDTAHRRIQNECPGDTGDEWDRGDVIIAEMEEAMRRIDARAFYDESNFWPWMLLDING